MPFVPIAGSDPVELGLISGHGRDRFESRAGNGNKRRQIADSSSEPLTMPGDPEPHLDNARCRIEPEHRRKGLLHEVQTRNTNGESAPPAITLFSPARSRA
jgi:hypothetical protein